MTLTYAWAIPRTCAFTLCTALAALPNRASACEFPNTAVLPGILSGESDHSSASIPRTVAFVTTRTTPRQPGTTDQWVVAQLDTGEAVVAVEVPGTKVSDTDMIVRPSQPLPQNVTLSAFRWVEYEGTYQTTTSTDDTAPSRPEVAGGQLRFHDGTKGCMKDSCGDTTSASVQLKALPVDDQTPASGLVYAIYSGSSSEEVQTTMNAHVLYTGSSIGSDLTLWQLVGNDWIDRDVFVSVAAIDQSGNVSERSAPVQINTGDSGGCAMKRRWRSTRLSNGVLVVIAALGWLRRRRGSTMTRRSNG